MRAVPLLLTELAVDTDAAATVISENIDADTKAADVSAYTVHHHDRADR